MPNPQDHEETARKYIKAVEECATGEALAQFLSPDVSFVLFPNRLATQGNRCGLAGMLESAEKGRKLLANQRYEITKVVAMGNCVALELSWECTLKLSAVGLPAGGQMRGHFATFLEFRDGRIVSQHQYDCLDPW
ncbi:MAG: nuclear transport factor 2 family protein [Candidatus Acidiferrales bacterium]